MMYTWKKEHAGVTRFITSSVFAIDCGGRIYTLASVNSKDGYKFKPIAGACKDKALYASNFTTQEAAIDAALKDNYTVYEFGNEDEFYAWLGQRYAATVLPAADVPVKTNEQTYDFYRNIYAIVSSATNEVQVLTIVPEISKFMFFPINGRQCRPRFFDTGHECVEDAIADGLKVYEFKSEIEYYGWLGKLYAATTPPAAEPKEKNVSAHSLHILEDKIASMDRIFGRKLEELAMMVGKLQANENRHTQPSENRDGQNREDGFYIVNRPPLPIPFVAQSINGKWYIPGEKLHYGGYLRVHSKVDMSE